MLWLTSLAALPMLKTVSLHSSVAGERFRALATKIAAHGFEPVERALAGEIARRAEAYIAGLEAYRRHPFRRRGSTFSVIWREGTTRLLDYGCHRAGSVVLVIPSMINRHYVLDLLPERSFVRHLVDTGLRVMVIDWGVPGEEESRFNLTDYIAGRLEAAFGAAACIAGAPIAVVGYCMGGLLALAVALRRRPQVACLALLATPWDFHAGGSGQAQLVGLAVDCCARPCGAIGNVPVELIQTLFFILAPFAGENKFIRFAALDPTSDEARRFVALEDWINDGVPLALGVARNCACSWYGGNDPARGVWQVAGQRVRPQALRRPALVVVPGRDRIVPPSSAEPLAAALGTSTVMRPPLGHVGMMSALRAPDILWTPVAQWLLARLAER
jgi:polyhydroxyalkanoate synthase